MQKQKDFNFKKFNIKEKNIKKVKINKKELYLSFNVIKGFLIDENIIINEFNEYILMVKVYNFNSIKFLTENMKTFGFKEIELFVYKNEYYASLKFDKELFNVNNNERFNIHSELIARDTEFKILTLYEIYKLIIDKVYRTDVIEEDDFDELLSDKKNNKKFIQNYLYAKNVYIKDEYIYFNNSDKSDNSDIIRHQILGLQMYPSFLYDGFLSEINYLGNIETTTYIKNIDLEKVKKNINNNSTYNIVKDYIKDKNKLFNTCFYIHIWGNKEEINNKKEIVFKIANKYHVILNEFISQQRRAYSAFLPLMNNNIKCYRALDDISGILPFNIDVINRFSNGQRYGYELISNNIFNYKRHNSGVILSSNRESKRRFIQDERDYVAVNLRKGYKVIDFAEYCPFDNLYKMLFLNNKDEQDSNISDIEKYKIYKMFCFLCLGAYKENQNIEKNDIEVIKGVFSKLDDKIEDLGYIKVKETFISNIEKNYNFVYKKLAKQYQNPNKNIINNINTIITIFDSFKVNNKEYYYIYNIQEVINCLSYLFNEIFNNKSNNLYLLSSYNDFLLLNNEYVATEMLKAPYINIIDISPNDLMKINAYLNLPNKDLVHLRNQKYYAGMLYTNECEFNYYIEKEESEDDI